MRRPPYNKKSRQKYPYPINLNEWVGFYQLYLFRPLWLHEINALAGAKPDDRIIGKTSQEGEAPDPKRQKAALTKLGPFRHYLNGPDARFHDVWLEIFQEFVELCKENQINLEVVFNVFHYKTLLARPLNKLDEFKIKLARIHPFYDFATLNRLSIDNTHWAEASHYYNTIGEAIAQEIKKGSKSKLLVSHKNIKEHIQKERLHILKSIPDLLKKDKKIYLNQALWETQVNFLEPVQRKNLAIETPATIKKDGITLLKSPDKITIELQLDRPLEGSYNMLMLEDKEKSLKKIILFNNNRKIYHRTFSREDKFHYSYIPIASPAKTLRLEIYLKPSALKSVIHQLRLIRLTQDDQ